MPLIGSQLSSIITVDLNDGEANQISSPTGCRGRASQQERPALKKLAFAFHLIN